ncbi:hypothetical protein FIV42_17200 [Persicimonas caeni]|uniref:Uncharacterized protein n=1 Tax=Persicimonas caeni TaxID=2292766 RepID=A0A4Y6PXD8_PERCE|nr:hypothetical protein [Persicimonas caeni]QDG52415.1 hypothetical protein FIV42_17200 [Persicimonas caeni]QED33637.1 hypothetical protein FRD00_17195 [Persicimonas caeni]
MGITETSIIYGIIGAVVASAMWLASPIQSLAAGAARFALHLVLWPFFAPVLLGGAANRGASSDRASKPRPPDLDPRVDRAERRLLDALTSLDGVAEDVLGLEMQRVRELTGSLATMARRIGEMDELLATDEFDAARAERALEALRADAESDNRARRDSVEARLRNIRRLEQMRRALSEDLERAILEIEEISSQIRLLRFADRPEHEVSGLIQDIAATVEGLSEGLLSTR